MYSFYRGGELTSLFPAGWRGISGGGGEYSGEVDICISEPSIVSSLEVFILSLISVLSCQ
jgi:hypothetical protein